MSVPYSSTSVSRSSVPPIPHPILHSSTSLPSSISRLDTEVTSLLTQLQSSFLSLVSPSTTQIGPVLDSAASADYDGDPESSGPAPLDFSSSANSFSSLQSTLLRQQFTSEISVSSFLDASERLLQLIAFMKRSASLNRRSRFSDMAKFAKEIKRKTRENEREIEELLRELGSEAEQIQAQNMSNLGGNESVRLEQIEQYLELSLIAAMKEGVRDVLSAPAVTGPANHPVPIPVPQQPNPAAAPAAHSAPSV
jgi:hypothetical protein